MTLTLAIGSNRYKQSYNIKITARYNFNAFKYLEIRIFEPKIIKDQNTKQIMH